MNEIKEYTEKIFGDIKHINECGNEYWLARELQVALEYKEWRKFRRVIDRAKEACANSGYEVSKQLVEVDKLSKRNNNAMVKIEDFKLSRYMCYLIVQNADLRKKLLH